MENYAEKAKELLFEQLELLADASKKAAEEHPERLAKLSGAMRDIAYTLATEPRGSYADLYAVAETALERYEAKKAEAASDEADTEPDTGKRSYY